YPKVTSVVTLPEDIYHGKLAYKSYQPYVRDIKKKWKVFCNTPSDCSSLQIIGPDSVCNLRDTLVFRIKKNAGCTAPAVWQTDTTFSKVLFQTDSTISMLLTKPGMLVLQAFITSGCTGLS